MFEDDDFEIELPDGFRGVQMNGSKSKKNKAKTKRASSKAAKQGAAGKVFRSRLASQSSISR